MDKDDFSSKINKTKALLQIEAKRERGFLRILVGILSVSNILMMMIMFYVLNSQNYFIIQPNGEVNKLKSKKLELNYDMIYKYADTVVINTFNYSYKNIDNVFDRNALYYTAVGLDNLQKAFKTSNLIEYTKKYTITKSTVPTNEVYKVVPTKFGIDVYRSYSSEEVSRTERQIYPSVIYELNIIKSTSANGQLYQLKTNSIKEYSYKEYKTKMGL